jgi:ABC-type multidrug transport system fused ATPase/permease subunit
MTLDDLYPLDQSITSQRIHIQLQKARASPGQKHDLAKSLARVFAIPLLLPIAPRIAMGAFQLCQPFLINTILEYLNEPADRSSPSVGYGLIGATILIFVGIAFAQAFYWYYQERTMYMIRGALVGLIYQQTKKSKLSLAEEAPITLMSTDVDRIVQGFLSLHEFWANTVQVALACWLLSRHIGAAFAAPLIIVGCCAAGSAVLGKFIGPHQRAWMGKIQERVGYTASAIGQMKQLKISGLSLPVTETIQGMRLDEITTGGRFRFVIILSAMLGSTPLCLSPIFALVFASQTLDTSTVFTSLSYILHLTTPLAVLFQMYPNLLAALTCLDRIQSFLEQEWHSDFRQIAPCQSVKHSAGAIAKSAVESQSSQPIITISEASFGWEIGKPCLHNINLSISAWSLTMVVGPVASGKSTLCKALLGRTPTAEGQVMMNFPIRHVTYCDQVTHLLNMSIRENIVGFATFDQTRYDEVIEATMLRADLATLPRGDQRKVGSNGITLSGGQKQRVSLARALYLDSNIAILDDILSGLDADTAHEVFRRTLSAPNGLLRQRKATVVVCTHSVKYLPFADHIIALGTDGRIVEQGSFPELIANNGYIHNLNVNNKDNEMAEEGSSIQPDPLHAVSSANTLASTQPNVDLARMMGDTAVYRYYVARIGTLHVISFLIFGFGWGFFTNFPTIWLRYWSDDAVSVRPLHTKSFYAGIYGLFQASALLSLFFLCMTSFIFMIRVSGAKLHHDALTTAINAPLRFFAATDIGVITNYFSQDMTLVDGQLPMALVNLACEIFSCLAMAGVIATSSPFLSISYPFLIVVLYGIQKFYLRTSRQLRLLDPEAGAVPFSPEPTSFASLPRILFRRIACARLKSCF